MEKFCKLTIAYMAEVLTDDEYLTETAVLKKAIEEAKREENPKERDLTPPKELLELDYRSIYETLTPEERRRFRAASWKARKENDADIITEPNELRQQYKLRDIHNHKAADEISLAALLCLFTIEIFILPYKAK